MKGMEKRQVKPGHVASVFFMVCLLNPYVVWAVKFDIWETGISCNEIVSLAKEHDIAIMKSGIVAIRQHFDPKLIDDSFYKSSEVYYRTTLSDHPSIIYLRLTDNPKFLYEIEVQIFNIFKDKDEFVKGMINVLQEKYGTYQKRWEAFLHYYEWIPDSNSRIILKSHGEVQIIYTDVQAKKALDAKRKQEIQKSIRKDGSKF